MAMDGGCCIERQSIANEVLVRMQAIAGRAANLSERVYGKLAPVMTCSPPVCEGPGSINKSQEFPPLFNEYRACLDRFESALNGIEDAISRTEI